MQLITKTLNYFVKLKNNRKTFQQKSDSF